MVEITDITELSEITNLTNDQIVLDDNTTELVWNGWKLFSYKDDYVTRLIAREGDMWQSNLAKMLVLLLDKGDVYVDAGSHIGSTCLDPSRVVGENGKVFAFEVNKELYQDCLLKTLSANKCSNVTSYNLALGCETQKVGYGEPFMAEAGPNYGMVQVVKESDELDTLVDCVRLDDMGIDRVKLMKLDVQGMEMDILKGSEKLISQHKPYLIVELENFLEDYGSSPEELIVLLSDWGYTGYLIEENFPTNFLFIHESNMREFKVKYAKAFGIELGEEDDYVLGVPYTINEDLLKTFQMFSGKQYEMIKVCLRI